MDIFIPGSRDISFKEAVEVQRQLAGRVSVKGKPGKVGLIAGVDVSTSRHTEKGRAAVVVLSYPGLKVVETQTVEDDLAFPYIPGLLSFREIPLLVKAWSKLGSRPDLLIVDGHGLAHPRRLGIASHFGLIAGIPAIGCAKTRLCGRYSEPPMERGSFSPLMEDTQQIGTVLRTRESVKPVFISPGNGIDFKACTEWALKACSVYRLPEPIRQAHRAASGYN